MAGPLEDKDTYLSERFEDLNLSGQEVSSKVFEEVSFNQCDFSEMVFSDSKFIDCQFSGCNLSLASLKNCRFTDVVFEDCKLLGIDWTRAAWPSVLLSSPLQFSRCIISDSTFFGLSLEEITIQECKAHDVDFREGNFREADFTYTDFSNSLFNSTNLAGTDFTEAINYTIDVFNNEIKGAKFSRLEAVRLLDSLEIELVD